jgi:hypothetical protein
MNDDADADEPMMPSNAFIMPPAAVGGFFLPSPCKRQRATTNKYIRIRATAPSKLQREPVQNQERVIIIIMTATN